MGTLGVLLIGLLTYSQTAAFHWDEGFHLLAARFISAGKRPYLDFLFAQAPLNAYWVSLWFRLLHPGWRLAHVLASCETWISVLLMARYVWKRFPVEQFGETAAVAVTALYGLLLLTFDFGAIAQAYAFCLLMMVAAFRMTVAARERPALWWALAAGTLAGAAISASLLTAAMAPVLLFWLWYYNQTGNRWTKAVAFVAGGIVPALTVLRPLLQAPERVWFDMVKYHALYRRVDWPGATTHDIEVLSSWIQDTQQFLLIGLAVLGWLRIRKSEWAEKRRVEFRLALWLVAGVFVQNVTAHPTFPQYFIVGVPFVALLACAGLYVVLTRLNAVQQGPRIAVVMACFMILALGRGIFEGRDSESWQNLEKVAKKVNEVTPPNAVAMLQEPIYFLTGREVPFGMEFDFAHKLDLGKEKNGLFHILPMAELERQIKAGQFPTAALCDEDDRTDKINQMGVYSQKFEQGACTVWWAPKKK